MCGVFIKMIFFFWGGGGYEEFVDILGVIIKLTIFGNHFYAFKVQNGIFSMWLLKCQLFFG